VDRLDGLPFMPQMFQYCGSRFRVFKRAHKTCDTIHGTGGRRMDTAVHLEGIHCGGEAMRAVTRLVSYSGKTCG